jgi:hypothetical protein
VNELEERLAMVAEEEERRRSDGPVFGAYFARTMFPVMGGSQRGGHGSDEAANWTN